MTRIVFLGTPDPAVPTLRALGEEHEVALAVTQPDRPVGRSSRPAPSPVKEAADSMGIPVAQPESGEELLSSLQGAGTFDVGVVVAYGRILSKDVIDLPRLGMLNLHFSLLPRWRGAAPVNRALMAGDAMTGVTIIRIDEGLDTGPVLTAQAVDIREDENAADLTERLAKLGSRLLAVNLPRYVSGELVPVAQSDEGATYASKLTKEDRDLGTDPDPQSFVSRVRGLAPTPGARLVIDGRPHKILRARPSSDQVPPGRWEARQGWPVVGLEGGAVRIDSLHPPGKKPMTGEDWLRGLRAESGATG